MKKIFCIPTLLSMILSFSIFTGCNEDSPTKPDEENDIVGTWELTKMSSEYQGEKETVTESQIDSSGIVWTLKIRADGSIEQITNMSGPLVTLNGTWKTSAGQLTLTQTGPTGGTATLEYEYAIKGNILELYWKLPAGTEFYAEFTKQ